MGLMGFLFVFSILFMFWIVYVGTEFIEVFPDYTTSIGLIIVVYGVSWLINIAKFIGWYNNEEAT